MDPGRAARDDGGMSQIPSAPQEPPASGQVPPGQVPPGAPQYGQQPPGQPGYGAAPTVTNEMAPDQQRLWAVLAHLSPLVAALLGTASAGSFYTGWLGPLVIFLVLKDRGIFVRRQAAEALNVQILFTVVYLVGILLGVVTLGIGLLVTVPILVVIGIVLLVFQIIAAVKANQGVDYRYPLSWRLVR